LARAGAGRVEGEVRPVYAEGFFHVTWGLIHYTIVFDYVNNLGFWERMRDPRERVREEDYARKRMQELMDEERVVVNGVETRTIVDYARLEFRGSRTRHSMVFHCRIPYEPIDGVNVYENYYEGGRAPYPYAAHWIVPPNGRILSIEGPGRVEYAAGGRIGVITVDRGASVPGYESVEFLIRRPGKESLL